MDYSLFAPFVSEFNSFKFNYLLVRWQKMALLVLRRVGLCVGQNQMCHLCGWLKLFLKNVRWEKIKIQKRWLLGRLSDGSFVQSLYVYFCFSFLLCRLLGLQVTVCKQTIDPPLIQIVLSKLDLFFHNRTYLRRKKSGWRLLAVMHSALIFKQAL
jgi:hypothetical protein